jgi:hypothetical protein
MIRESGGVAPKGIEQTDDDLDEQQAERVEDWLRDLVNERKRMENLSGNR